MSFVKTNFPSVLGTFSDISSQQLLLLTNEKRQENGLSPLTGNEELDRAAANKASDMFSKDYWAHNAPDGTTPWVFIKSAGYNYIYAGENLARGFTSASDVVNAWMNSESHRKNMLSPNYNDVGFGVATGRLNGEETVLVVEFLGNTTLGSSPIAARETEKTEIEVAKGSPVAVNTSPEITPVPTVVLTIAPNANTLGVQKGTRISENSQALVKPLINSQSMSLATARLIISLFIFVLILDMIIIERKKIVRFVGHNLDHVFLFSLMLVIIIILAKGSII